MVGLTCNTIQPALVGEHVVFFYCFGVLKLALKKEILSEQLTFEAVREQTLQNKSCRLYFK